MLRLLNEQVALEQAKLGKAATQIQKVARSVGVSEKYAYYKRGVKFVKSHTAGNSEREGTGKPIPLDENSHEHIPHYVQNLGPQERCFPQSF